MRWLATIALLCTAMLTPSIAMASEPESPPEEASCECRLLIGAEEVVAISEAEQPTDPAAELAQIEAEEIEESPKPTAVAQLSKATSTRSKSRRHKKHRHHARAHRSAHGHRQRLLVAETDQSSGGGLNV